MYFNKKKHFKKQPQSQPQQSWKTHATANKRFINQVIKEISHTSI
jgi:hypothetical protein